jgi:hypothetical protein
MTLKCRQWRGVLVTLGSHAAAVLVDLDQDILPAIRILFHIA